VTTSTSIFPGISFLSLSLCFFPSLYLAVFLSFPSFLFPFLRTVVYGLSDPLRSLTKHHGIGVDAECQKRLLKALLVPNLSRRHRSTSCSCHISSEASKLPHYSRRHIHISLLTASNSQLYLLPMAILDTPNCSTSPAFPHSPNEPGLVHLRLPIPHLPDLRCLAPPQQHGNFHRLPPKLWASFLRCHSADPNKGCHCQPCKSARFEQKPSSAPRYGHLGYHFANFDYNPMYYWRCNSSTACTCI
jgi:hypothetical protein